VKERVELCIRCITTKLKSNIFFYFSLVLLLKLKFRKENKFFFLFKIIFKPPLPVGAGGGYMFSGRPCVRPCVRDSRGSFMFPRYLQYLLTDFRQTFVTGASRERDELVGFWGQKVKVQGHGMTKYIPDFHVSAISPVSVDGFLPNFCHWYISGQR